MAALAAATLAVLLAGCSSDEPSRLLGPVQVAVPGTAPETTPAACSALLAALPAALDGNAARSTTDPVRTAAWGEPAITLLCGAPAADLDLPPLILDDLAFSTERLADRVLWTTRDRAVAVRLDVPLAYESQADVVLPLVPVLRSLPPSASPSPGAAP